MARHVYSRHRLLTGLCVALVLGGLGGSARAAVLDLVIADYNHAKVLSYDVATGTQNTNLSTPPYFTPTSSGAWGIATDRRHGWIYVVANNSSAVTRFNFNGTLDTSFNGTGSVALTDGVTTSSYNWNATVGPDGNLYVAGEGANRIWKVNATTAAVSLFSTTHLVAPTDLEFGGDGNLYVADYASGNIEKFNGTTGAWISTPLPYSGGSHATGVAGSVYDPSGIAFAPDGSIYITDYVGDESKIRIRHYTSTFTWLNDLPTFSYPTEHPYASKFSPQGKLYTSEYNSTIRYIYEWDLATSTKSIFATGPVGSGFGYFAFTPEPSSAVLLVIGGAMMLRRRKT